MCCFTTQKLKWALTDLDALSAAQRNFQSQLEGTRHPFNLCSYCVCWGFEKERLWSRHQTQGQKIFLQVPTVTDFHYRLFHHILSNTTVLQSTCCAWTIRFSGASLLLHPFGELLMRQSSPPDINNQILTDVCKSLKCCAHLLALKPEMSPQGFVLPPFLSNQWKA